MGAKRTYEIEPDSSAWVQKIFDWYIAGHGTVPSAALLNMPMCRPHAVMAGRIGGRRHLDIDVHGEWSYNRSKWVSRPRRNAGRRRWRRRPWRDDPREWVRSMRRNCASLNPTCGGKRRRAV